MRLWTLSFALLVPINAACQTTPQQPPDVPIGAGRAAEPGITRTVIRDDEKVTIIRVLFAPGAVETMHTHTFDLVVTPIRAGRVDWVYGDKEVTRLAVGEVTYVPRGMPHRMSNTGTEPFELIAVGVK